MSELKNLIKDIEDSGKLVMDLQHKGYSVGIDVQSTIDVIGRAIDTEKNMKSYIECLEDNISLVYDKEHVMRNRRKYFGDDAEQYVSYCDLRSIIKVLKEEKAELQVQVRRWKRQYQILKGEIEE